MLTLKKFELQVANISRKDENLVDTRFFVAAVNGPLASLGSSVVTSTAPLNNRHPSDGEILKWFSPEVLKTQLPSMPPLPTHGTKVMTVDEIERN